MSDHARGDIGSAARRDGHDQLDRARRVLRERRSGRQRKHAHRKEARQFRRHVGVLVPEVGHRDGEAFLRCRERGEHGCDARRRGKQPIPLGRQAKAGEIVDHSAGFVAQRRVDRAANCEAGSIGDDDVLQECRRIAARDLDGDLIVDIEDSDRLTRGAMFLFGRREDEWSGKAQSIDERRAAREESVVVRRSLDQVHRSRSSS